jgi:acyl-coenzyme A synthetase/AMP-(fatty) acid ligase
MNSDRFWTDVASARVAIRAHPAICNLSKRRYDFMVLLSAAILNGQTTILPSSRAVGAIEAAVEGWPSVLSVDALADLPDPGPDAGPDAETERAGMQPVPGEVHVFTSGSTGEAIRHTKTWDSLAGGARLTAEIIERAGLGPENCMILGTTPHQHMYGLEAAVFTALSHGYCVYDAPVFYPADLETAINRARELGIDNLVLASSPPHLKFLEEALRDAPQVRCIISATAPLHKDLAAKLETGAGRKVFEIYGSTETGSLAWRRTTADELWTPLDGFRLTPSDDGAFADAPHLIAGAILGDDIELAGDGRFRLLGRRGDMVSIAGKRQSLGALNAALTSIAEISDGVIVRKTVNGEDRLSALIVTDPAGETDPGTLRQIVKARMRRDFDAVFVPRRISIVPRIPRNETGKIIASDLEILTNSGTPAQGDANFVRGPRRE